MQRIKLYDRDGNVTTKYITKSVCGINGGPSYNAMIHAANRDGYFTKDQAKLIRRIKNERIKAKKTK